MAQQVRRAAAKIMAKKSIEVANVENTKAAIENENEMSASDMLNAYLANHAVEHYCAALDENEEEISSILEECKKEAGVYWLYTQPAIDGKKADGTPLPTQEEWEKANPESVRVDKIVGKQWYKRPFTLGDARGVKSIINGYDRYHAALEGAKKSMSKKADDGKLAFACMSKEERERYISELLAMNK